MGESREVKPFMGSDGADDQNRTGDLLITNQLLCRLSYIGIRS